MSVKIVKLTGEIARLEAIVHEQKEHGERREGYLMHWQAKHARLEELLAEWKPLITLWGREYGYRKAISH